MKTWYADVLEKGDIELRQGIAEALTGQRREKPDRNADVGRIVEFLRGGRHICGVVRPNPAGRKGLTILDHTGREYSLRRSKIVSIGTERIKGKQRHSLIEQLTEIHARRERAKDLVELEILWELAIESATHEFELKDLTELYFGEEGHDDRAVLARALDDGIWFVRHGRSYAPRTRDSVVRGRERTGRAARRQLEQQVMADWLRAAADGEVVSEPPGAGEAIDLLQEFVLHGADSERRGEISQLMKAAHLHGRWAAFDLLVELGHWKPDENLDLLRNDVPIEFPTAVLAEAEASCREPLPRARPWWIGKVLAISPRPGVKDRAFSFRRKLLSGYRVGIHLALPAARVREGGLVDAEIMVRGVALNLPEQTIPLIPPQVIEAAEWSDRRKTTVLSIELLLDRHFKLRRSTIRIRRMRADKLLDFTSATQAADHDAVLRGLLRYAKHLHDHRLAEGEDGSSAATSTLSDVTVVGGEPTFRHLTAEEPARTIYEELSLLANAMAGRFCAENGIPAINEKLGRDDSGREAGTPISDPLGSAVDFSMQRQLLQWMREVTTIKTEADLSRVLEATAYAREVKRDVERASRRYWLLKYQEAIDDGVTEGVVIERLAGGVIVGLLDDQLRTFVPTRRERNVDAGDQVRVEVDRVSARRNELAVSIAEKVATV